MTIIITTILIFGNLGAKKEEARLQNLVDEIMIDIENGDYDTAEIKANQLYWDSSWSSEPVEKWDKTRETIIKQINEAQGVEEENGFFDWLQ